MKKILIFCAMLVLIACAFSISVFADEIAPVTDTYYLVQSLDIESALALKEQGKTNLITYEMLLGSTKEKETVDGKEQTTKSTFFYQFEDGSHVEIILAEDIFVPKTIVPSDTGVLINTPITVTIRYNGFAHYIDSSGSSGNNGFYLRHANASLRLIGQKAIDLEDGKISNKFVIPTGDIANGNFNSTGCNLDIFKYSSYYVNVQYGNLYTENIRSYTGKGLVATGGSTNGTYEFVNCALDGGNSYSIELMGNATKMLKIDGGYYEKVEIVTPITGTYVKNATISEIKMDCYNIKDQIWEIRDSEINKISTATGRVRFDIYDSKIPESGLYIGADGPGAGIVNLITSPTCSKEGTMASYSGNGNAYDKDTCVNATVIATKTVSTLPIVDHSATDDNDCTTDVFCEMCGEVLIYPKQNNQHSIYIVSIKYDNGFASVGKQMVKCENCNAVDNEEDALPLFVAQGYTKNSDDTGFGTGFQINRNALVAYETLNNTKITFGIVVFNPQYLNGATFVDGNINATKGALQVNMSTEYTNCHLLVNGFDDSHEGLELVFAGYAYEGTDTSKLEIMQKEYISTEQTPVDSPMCSQVNGLYTVKLSTVLTPKAVGNKENLDAFVKKS